MNVKIPVITLAISMMIGFSGYAGGAILPAAATQLTDSEIDALVWVREEEKLARDTYITLHGRWGVNIFDNISRSEQKHMDSMLVLLNIYDIADPVISDDVGAFNDEILDALYDKLIEDGGGSLSDALFVGAFIEELDIKDIREALDEVTQADITTVYENLLAGSYKHLNAFVGQIENLGVNYQAQVLEQSEVDEILGKSPPGLSNDSGLSGLFVDPASAGNGFDFNVHEAGLTVFYYGHTSSGERLWLISQLYDGDLDYGVPYELNMFEVIDGLFGQSAQGETLWGTLILTLTDCNAGSAVLTGLDGNAEFNLSRLVSQLGGGCQ